MTMQRIGDYVKQPCPKCGVRALYVSTRPSLFWAVKTCLSCDHCGWKGDLPARAGGDPTGKADHERHP